MVKKKQARKNTKRTVSPDELREIMFDDCSTLTVEQVNHVVCAVNMFLERENEEVPNVPR